MNLFYLSLRGTKQSKLFAHQQREGFTCIFFICHSEVRSNLNCLHTEVSHFSTLKTAPQRENIQKISKNEKLRGTITKNQDE